MNAPTPLPSSTPQTRLHLDFLDGVRALAALCVVVHHLYLSRFGMSARSQWPGSLGNSLLYGHLAVGVFLVVSGFCLALPVTESRQLKSGALAFYGKRARRILPPFFAALLGSVVLFWLRHRFAGGEAISAREFVLNALLLQDLFPNSNTFNPPLWSVAVEWKIYFLFPALVLVWRRFGSLALLWTGAILGGASTVLWFWFGSARTWGHSCPWFIGLFTLGIAASGVARSETSGAVKWRARMPLVAIVGAFAVVVLLWQFPVTGKGEFERFVPALPFIDGATGILSAAMLVILSHTKRDRSVSKRALEWRPLVWVGTFAYSLYLTHEPLIRVLNLVIHRAPGLSRSHGLETAALFLVGLPLLLGAAFLFYVVFERPFLSRRADTSRTLKRN